MVHLFLHKLKLMTSGKYALSAIFDLLFCGHENTHL